MQPLSAGTQSLIEKLEAMRPEARKRDRERRKGLGDWAKQTNPGEAPKIWTAQDLIVDTSAATIKANKAQKWMYGCVDCYQSGGWISGVGRDAYPCPKCDGLNGLIDRVNRSRLPSKFYGKKYDRSRQNLAGEGSADLLTDWGRGVFGREDVSGAAFVGAPGRGKSHLAYTIGQWVLFQGGRRVRWVNWPKHLEGIKASYGDRRTRSAECWDGLPTKGLVIVDDFGAAQATEWAKTQSWALFEECPQAVTLLITTNLNPSESGAGGMADALGERAASRLFGVCGSAIFVFGGEDKRRAI
tara:strand:+ start:4224 stop:5120 length:897 start_codon:yes stop_codon:yes gene_type:complete